MLLLPAVLMSKTHERARLAAPHCLTTFHPKSTPIFSHPSLLLYRAIPDHAHMLANLRAHTCLPILRARQATHQKQQTHSMRGSRAAQGAQRDSLAGAC
jgi:hypothetical protein